jgi:hypothetical protein
MAITPSLGDGRRSPPTMEPATGAGQQGADLSVSLSDGGLAEELSGVYLHPTHQTLALAPNGWDDDRDGRSGALLSRRLVRPYLVANLVASV